MQDLAGKVAVVTGASSGIGAGLAKHFVAQGMKVGLCSRRDPVLADGGAVLSRSVDVADEAAVKRFCDAVAARFGRIDLWVNNAGVAWPIGMLRDLDLAEFRRNHEINFWGVVHGSRAFIAHVRGGPKRADEAVLINLSSAAARAARAGMAAYSSAKAAIDRFTEAVAEEEKGAGIVVMALSPGMVESGTQALVRSMPVERMPASENNRRVAAAGKFNSAEHVAQHLLRIAFDSAARPPGFLYIVPNQF
jgi:NAD(P)-dependent dehydrogenase (short-subunit alcohol dehydrogenase family)